MPSDSNNDASPAGTSTKQDTSNAASASRGVNFSNNTVEHEDPAPAEDLAAAEETAQPKVKLYKSNRLKGYITLILAGVINYSAASNSQNVSNNGATAATDGQRAYAEAVAITSTLLTIVIFVAHMDRVSPLKGVWEKAFGDGSLIELLLIAFLVIWWTIATAISTTVRGIAGDGKGQWNLYYSTWCCCWTSYWTLERWLVAYGWASFKAFISSWPFRAPGWIAVCMFSFLSFMWYLDLYSNHVAATEKLPLLQQHYNEIGEGQWEWLLFVGAASLLPALVFIIVELFRETSTDSSNNGLNGSTHSYGERRFSVAAAAQHRVTATVGSRSTVSSSRHPLRDSPLRSSRVHIPQRQNPLPEKGNSTGGKGQLENILEGFCLVLLVLAWIPTVIVATSPGGAASLVGNAYFCTWINTVFVMETFIWFVHDLRKGVHSALQVKEREYQKRQQEVLQKSRALEAKRLAAGTWQNDAVDDIELDEVQPTATMRAVMSPLPTSPHHPVFDLSRQPQAQEGAPEQNPQGRQQASHSPTDMTHLHENGRLRGTELDDDLVNEVVDGEGPGPGSTMFFEADLDATKSPRKDDLENPFE